MANYCEFNMMVKGNKSDLEKFDILVNDYSWRVYEVDKYEIGENYIKYAGDCAWSVISSMADGLEEITKECNVIAEVYSEEYGLCFNEHFIFDKGNTILNDCVEAYECYCGDSDGCTMAVKFGSMLQQEYNDDVDWDKLENMDNEWLYYGRLEQEWTI